MEDRRARLSRTPDAVLETPDAVADWIDDHTRRATRPADLDAAAAGKRAKDPRDFSDSYRVNLSEASHGHTVHSGVRLPAEQLDFCCEAVTLNECDCVDPKPSLRKIRGRG
ncbi:hypothetical protein GCM10012275_28070 [Longimycelium tulufanense]|uniref:Uncharacterized protein n=1 Tax=Longimycelium tulufanense TaxID=907463 RepID=A0A8J3C8N0_9PSEU|nr:hypothetical protein GCM10012275_28070 [Longimycelium tulufanense]